MSIDTGTKSKQKILIVGGYRFEKWRIGQGLLIHIAWIVPYLIACFAGADIRFIAAPPIALILIFALTFIYYYQKKKAPSVAAKIAGLRLLTIVSHSI